jgi:rhomboid protease GluP
VAYEWTSVSNLDAREGPPRAVSAPPQRSPLVPPDWLDKAPVTRALLALNIGIFALELVLSRSYIPSGAVQLQLGASYPLATIGEDRWETLVTACFLHADLIHVGLNMLVLWQAGPLVERTVGSARMAPMYLVAGVFGNLLSVVFTLLRRGDWYGLFGVGSSGANLGLLAAALVVGWRTRGWKGPVTQAMARWLGFLVAFGLLENLIGGHTNNAAHIGGAIAGGVMAGGWKLRYKYSDRATRVVLAACVGVVAASIGVLSFREATNPFASMIVQDRQSYAMRAVAEGRCRDAHDGLLAVERLRGHMESLRRQVEITCGHVTDR